MANRRSCCGARRAWCLLALALSTFQPAGAVRGQDTGTEPGARRGPAHDLPPVARELKGRVEQLRATGSLHIGDRAVAHEDLTLAVYEQGGFRQLWGDRRAAESLLRAVWRAAEHGLDPAHYHVADLAAGTAGGQDAVRTAELDLLSTDALLRLGRDLRFGKVEPQGPAGTVDSPWMFGGDGAVDRLTEVIASGRIEETLDGLRPQHFVYDGLMRALAALRRARSAGGWTPISPGPSMARDSVDARVPLVRQRLGLPLVRPQSGDASVFDAALEAAVKDFQHRHGLNEDGVVGRATLAALNVPVEQRLEQIRVNLERARWVMHELPDTYVAVNVAGAKTYLLQGDTVVFETRAIVGADYTRTPMFRAPMLYLDLNPTWTVPPGIVGEVLGLVQRDSTYLVRQRIRVLDPSGRMVDPSVIDFSRYTAADFPYLFRQDPGPANPLGEIKLMFPNEHSVYLHDTPTRGLFAAEERLLSHGCIRLEDPLALAELVIGDPVRWNRETLRAAIDEGVTRTIRLTRPVPVFVLYWTASMDLHGELHFYRDVYGRDPAILEALETDDGTTGGAIR